MHFLQWQQICEITPVTLIFDQLCVCHLQFLMASLCGDADCSVLLSSGNINV